MFDQNVRHLSDEDLVCLINGEAPKIAADQAREHYAECSICQLRLSQLRNALSEFENLHDATMDPGMVESGARRRDELKDRLTAVHPEPPPSWFSGFAQSTEHRSFLFASLVIFAFGIVALFRTGLLPQHRQEAMEQAARLVPDVGLTPGATHPVNLAEVCSEQQEDLDPEVPTSVKTIVFREYGMNGAKAEDYQVDYLINPQLGGTNDVRNLWPEPYGSTVWNARAKDALEDRLHHMVCNKEIDIAVAQHEIAADWIAAYKKYFQVDRPS